MNRHEAFRDGFLTEFIEMAKVVGRDAAKFAWLLLTGGSGSPRTLRVPFPHTGHSWGAPRKPASSAYLTFTRVAAKVGKETKLTNAASSANGG